MVSRHAIEQQLHRIGFNPFTWGRSEVSELCNIMMDDEVIIECVNGEYNNGFALFVATNHRVLLVDKKPFLYLTVEDVRFEQISDFNFRNRFLSAAVTIATSNKTLQFISYNKKRLRRFITCVQRRVVELRERRQVEQYVMERQFEQPPASRALPPVQAVATESSSRLVQEEAVIEHEQAAPMPLLQNHPHLQGIVKYTRGKLPKLHLHQESPPKDEVRQGDVYQQGYSPGSVPDYRAPA